MNQAIRFGVAVGIATGFLGAMSLAQETPKAAPSGKADWPQWRGPKRDDVSTDTGLLKEWPTEGPSLLWESRGAGRGYSSLALSKGRIYTVGDGPSTAEDKEEYLGCFDEANGHELWKSKLGAPYNAHAKQESWNSSRSTPTVDGELVYILTGLGDLICLETAQGKERWRKSMQKDLGGKKGDGWGYSESPLVDGDRLVCTPGGGKATMACLNKLTGETIWTAVSSGDGGAGHASIVPSEVGKTRIYVTTTSSGALGVRASDGKVLWTYPFRSTAVIPTPVVKGDLVFCGAGYNTGGALLRQIPAPDGGATVQEVYGLKKELGNKHGGVVLVGDYLYGDTNDSGSPWCADLMTGVQKWQKRGSGRGSASITAADGHLYIRFASGQMVLASASPDEYKETGSFKIPHPSGRPSWSHPVVTGQKLFLREGDYLLCYDLRAK